MSDEEKKTRIANLRKLFPMIENPAAADEWLTRQTEAIFETIRQMADDQTIMESALMHVALMFYLHGNLQVILQVLPQGEQK